MSTQLKQCALASLGLGLAVVVSCAYQSTESPTGTTETTGAVVTTNSPVVRVARTRCNRAAECNRIGPGQMYEDKGACMNRERQAAFDFATSCQSGVDPKLLDHCIDSLENQHCDAYLGPVTAMPDCRSYCAR
jgi:hypothetical protein